MTETKTGSRFLAVLAFVLLPCVAAAQGIDDIRTAQVVAPGETSISAQIEAQREHPRDNDGAGPPVDATGQQAEDPTANVIALQRAATQRQDDLREASERFILAQIEAAEKLNALRSENTALFRAAETRRIDDLITLRADYETRLAGAEAKRIDAIRAVDVNAVQNATERAVEQATVLAQQVDRSAETLRALVASTEQSVAASQRQSSTELSNRITALEQSQSFGQGRQTISDPALVTLADEVKKLAAAQSTSVGETTGSSNTIAYIAMGLSTFLVILSIGTVLWRTAPSGRSSRTA